MFKQKCFSIVIVSRNRSEHLTQCLYSLKHQIGHLDEILIIDNNSTDDTRDVVQKFKDIFSNGVLHYILEPVVNISHARNRGLFEAKYSWVVFIDDDCLASINWISHIRTSIALNAKAAAIIGLSKPYDATNAFSVATAFFYDYWHSQNAKGETVYNPEILDTKNVALNRNFLRRSSIQFDETLSLGEDCDMGIQINNARGIMIYNPRQIVTHKHPTTLRDFLVRQMSYSIAAMKLAKKWPNRRVSLIHNESMTNNFFRRYVLKKGGWRKSVSALFIVAFIAILNKVLFPLYTVPFARKAFSLPGRIITHLYLKR